MGIQEVLSTFVHGVYIIGAKEGDNINGMTAAWVCQCSFSPKMVAVAIAPERFTYELIERSGKFSVSLLRDGQIELAKRFGEVSGRDKNKFSDVDYSLIEDVPVLTDCLCWVVCELDGKLKSGDHYIITGRVLKSKQVRLGSPLIFRWEDYF